MLQNTTSCAIDNKSAWGVCSNTPKYSVHNNTLSIIFYITRCTRGVRVVFSVTRMRSSNSARIYKFDLRTEKIV